MILTDLTDPALEKRDYKVSSLVDQLMFPTKRVVDSSLGTSILGSCFLSFFSLGSLEAFLLFWTLGFLSVFCLLGLSVDPSVGA